MIQGETGIYKAFLIFEPPEGLVKAYRNMMYFANGIASYEAPGWLSLSDMINEAGDHGEFTDEQYRELTGKEPEFIPREEITELISALPFMPEPGPGMPSFVAEEIYSLETFEVPISEYGREVVDEVSSALRNFTGTDFEVVKKFDETGWASDDVMYNGELRHLMTNTEWYMQISVSFEWRKPENIDTMFIDFLAIRLPDGTWADVPEEIVDSAEYSFDLNASEGKRASTKIMELREKVRGQNGRVE